VKIRLGEERRVMISGGDRAPFEHGASTEATLEELAERLSELREHLRQVVTDLNRATSGDRAGNSSFAKGSLRCHACGRTRSTDHAGWTLRLCGDDVLHPFCPNCDRRHVDGNGRGATHAEDRLLL
jgi:hypothetical protein